MSYRDTQIIGSCGKLGRGKTALLVSLAYDCWLDGWNIYSNLHSMSDQREYHSSSGLKWSAYIEPKDLLSLKMDEGDKGFVFLDEAYIWYESRMGDKDKTGLTYPLFQSRKLGFDIGYTVQLRSSIDKRLRNLTDVLFVAKPYTRFTFRLMDEEDYTVKTINFRNPADYFELFNSKEVVGTPEDYIKYGLKERW